MADPTTPEFTDQSGPLDAGHTTTEYQTNKFVVLLTSILSALSLVIGFAEKLLPFLPPESSKVGMWAAIGFAALAGLKGVAYEVQRTALKIASLRAGVRVAAQPPAAGTPTDPATAAGNLSQ